MIPNTCEKGFTLVELMIAMAAALIVLGAIIGTFLSQSKSYEREAQVVEMQENARAGMQMMISELLMAGYDPTGNAGAGIVSANTNSIRFTVDLNGDGDVSDSNEDITYTLDTDELQLTRNNQPLAENIPTDGLVFTYYDDASPNNKLSSTPLSVTDRAKVRRITIQLKARTKRADPNYQDNDGYRTRTLTSDVRPRNLGL